MAVNESRPSRGFWVTLNKVAESPRRADEGLFSSIGEEAARAFAFHNLPTFVELSARLKKIKDLPTSRIPADTKDRFLAMYNTVRRGTTEVRSLHGSFNPVQEGIDAGSDEFRTGTCSRVIDIFDPAIENILRTGRVQGFDQFPKLSAQLMARWDQVNLKRTSTYLTWLVERSDNPKIVSQAQGVLDIATPVLRRMDQTFGPIQQVCSSFERKQQSS